MASTRSKRIEDYGLIGDGQTVALVAKDGAIDWLCWPRFDSDACFAALLGTEEHGTWQIAPTEKSNSMRRYSGDDLVLVTEFETLGGRIRLTDFMPVRTDQVSAVIRRLEAIEGRVEIKMLLRLRFGYGEVAPWIESRSDGISAEVGPDFAMLRGPGLTVDGEDIRASLTLQAGERADFVLQHSQSRHVTPRPLDPDSAQTATEHWWRNWIDCFDKPTEWPAAVKRSLLTLKALTYYPTGGIVAAPTLGLPEKPHGGMNWDYRYCWLRDSTFTLTAFLNGGFEEEALAWRDWLFRAIAGEPAKLRIMYRVDGGRRIDENEVDFLPGWNGAKPVRIGNAAASQRQLDVFGEVLDSEVLCIRAGLPPTARGPKVGERLVGHVERIWRNPDQGMWESRGKPQHYVYSKVMAWVAIDRFLKLDRRTCDLDDRRRAELAKLCGTIHADICNKGYDAERNSFMQSYGSRELDASVLLLPLVGFLPPEDPRIAGTIKAVETGLMEEGFVRRHAAPPRGPEEGVFLPCTCWLADCIAMQGRHDEARTLFERVLGVSNDLGLLSEEYHVPTKRLVGNFPQALTHIAIVNTGLGLCGKLLQRAGG